MDAGFSSRMKFVRILVVVVAISVFLCYDNGADDEVIFLSNDETVVARRPFISGPSPPSETDVAREALRGAYIKCPSIISSRRRGSGILACRPPR